MRKRDGFTETLVAREMFYKMHEAGLTLSEETQLPDTEWGKLPSHFYIKTPDYYAGLEKLREFYSLQLVTETLTAHPEWVSKSRLIREAKEWLDMLDNELEGRT